MNEQELKNALAAMQTGLETKSATQIADEIKALEVKYNAFIETKAGEIAKKEIKAAKDEFALELKKVQEHANKLDVKLQTKSFQDAGPKDELKALITDNFGEIKMVGRGNTVNIETKAVANMTLGAHLTGDQPRDYSMIVAMVPGQKLNFADLIQPITISGGTYTFPREGASEGSISTQTEGADKSQIDYDLAMIDANTDFIAGFAVYSKKMANNLPFLESFLPQALRRDYWKTENSTFNTAVSTIVTASTQIITGKNKVEMLVNELATLEGKDFMPNVMVVTPADFYNMLVTEKSTGAGYGLPGVVTFSGGQLAVNGIPVVKANWLAANKYYVGDFTRIKKIITEGLSVEFSNSDEDNFRKNNITARVEAQVGVAVERLDAVIYGDFTAV